MAGLNKALLIGNLGADPELQYTAAGTSVCNFSIATNESWVDKDGTKQERTEWHKITVWAKQAEACKKYLAKGSQVYVEGKMQTRSWDDKDGVKRYVTEVVAQSVVFLGSAGGGGQREESAPPHDDSDVPF